MKKLVLLVLLIQAAVMVAEKPSTNVADYPIAIKVLASHYRLLCGATPCQTLDVVVNGQPLELQSESGSGVLALGTYPAQLAKTGFMPTHSNGYDTFVVYRFLFPDGKTRDYDVVGVGSVPANP